MTTRAVVLQTYRYSDTSKILRLMTRERGPCSAIARGALRPRSRFGGLLEPFAEGDATLYVKEGRELHTLSGFELMRARRGLGRDLGRYTAASVMCELVMRLAPEHRDDRLYRTLIRALDALDRAGEHVRSGEYDRSGGHDRSEERSPEGSAESAAESASGGATGLRHIWALVDALGFRPGLERCTSCGRAIGEERACFDFAAGGLRCRACPASGPGIRPDELRSLRRLVRGVAPLGPVVGPQGRWLADFIRYHLSEGATLRSLPFLERLA